MTKYVRLASVICDFPSCSNHQDHYVRFVPCFFSFRTSPSTHPRPPSHLSFRPRPQRGEYKIMGWKLSKVYLGTSSRARLRTRVHSLLVQNRPMKIVVRENRSREESRIIRVSISFRTFRLQSFDLAEAPPFLVIFKRGKECNIRNSCRFNLYHFFFSF